MKKSLYQKFLLGYLLFAVLSFVTIATFSSWMMCRRVLAETADGLREDAIFVADEIGDYASEDAALEKEYNFKLEELAEILDIRIWIIDTDGEIAFDSAGTLTGSSVTAFDPTDDTSYYRVGNFYGMFSEKTLTVYSPITSGFSTSGYVLFHESVPQIYSQADDYLLPVYLTFVVIFFFSLIILLIFRISVAQPLKAITTAANEYAAGNLKYELKLKSEDEMGYLANTLNYMAHELSRSEDYQRQFIANVSHDFRSPLTSIKGYLEAIADGTIPPESQDKYIGIVIAETERLTNLTQSMLQLNSLDSRAPQLQLTDFDINRVIKSTCETFEGTCSRRDIVFDLIFPDVSTWVRADIHKIQQVIYNLVDNAIKFSHDNSVITIEVYERGEKVFISVKDTGIGIPRRSLNKIWTRFFKSDESRGRDKKGMGLGLAIVKEIIQAHNETIDVISTEGVGTEFIFRLPKGASQE